jgi:hypothetical protein
MTANLPAKQSGSGDGLPALIAAAGPAAAFVWDEFFAGNSATRRAYTHAVRRFLAWAAWSSGA